MATWVRTQQHSINWGYSAQLLASVPNGTTLNRIHFGWGFYGTTSGRVTTAAAATQLAQFGICTRSSADSGSPPSPITTPADVGPPLRRWLYWEARFPVVMGHVGGRPGVAQWKDSGGGVELSTKGQVLAAVGSGNTLNVYAVWDTLIPWDTSGVAQFWYWASLLHS
jgi:hypothetical protein